MSKREQKLRDASELLALVQHVMAQPGPVPGVRVAIQQSKALIDDVLDSSATSSEGSAPPWRHQAVQEPVQKRVTKEETRIVEQISNRVAEPEQKPGKSQVRELVDDSSYSGTFNRIQLTELRGQ